MLINDMHKVFRVLAQQMGMQQVRGILPDSIDIFINSAIHAKIQNVLRQSAAVANSQQGDVAGHSIESVNILQGLYRSGVVKFVGDDGIVKDVVGYNVFDDEVFPIAKTYPTAPAGKLKLYLNLPDADIMQYIAFKVKYIDAQGNLDKDYVGCRLIGSDVINETLRDYCNGADVDNPICVLLAEDNKKYLELYTGKKDIRVGKLDVRYIKNPKTVKWSTNESECDNCDLPEYCHYEIIQMAVQMYFQAIGATTPRSDSNNNNNNN